MTKLLIIGHARHGKDTLAEIWEKYFDLKFESSSQAAADIFIYEELKDKYGYHTPEQCYEDRMNRRAEWHDLICGYNKDDKARLAKVILEKSDCYVGMRSSAEIKACKDQGLFDLIIWVDASARLPLEPSSSFDISIQDADIIIDNNGSFDDLTARALRLGEVILR